MSRRGPGFSMTVKNALLLVLLITAVAFALRTVFPLGTDVINMQLGYFSSYVIMFVVGVSAHRGGLLDRIDYRTSRRWFIVSFAVVSVLAVTASFAVSWAIRRVGFLRKVFS